MKKLIIIITALFSITVSAFSQAPQGEFQLPLGNYFLWDGKESREDVHALIGYQDDWNFLVQILVDRNGEQMLFSKTFKAVEKRPFDGQFGAIKLDFEGNNNTRSIQLLKVNVNADGGIGLTKTVHYFYMSEFNGVKEFRMIIKDQNMVDIIDSILK